MILLPLTAFNRDLVESSLSVVFLYLSNIFPILLASTIHWIGIVWSISFHNPFRHFAAYNLICTMTKIYFTELNWNFGNFCFLKLSSWTFFSVLFFSLYVTANANAVVAQKAVGFRLRVADAVEVVAGPEKSFVEPQNYRHRTTCDYLLQIL